jgi:hypothetical protein
MIPLKNGSIIRLDEYDNCYRCDVYALPGFGWLFRVNNTPIGEEVPPEEIDVFVERIAMWIEQSAQHGTVIAYDPRVKLHPEIADAFNMGARDSERYL